MKKLLPLIGVAGAMIVGFVALPSTLKSDRQTVSAQKLVQARVTQLPMQTSPQKTISSPGFFYEDFESVANEEPYALPVGWTLSSSNSNGWRAGTITLSGDVFPGTSGYKYAFIFANGTDDNDAWAFTPAIHMEAGVENTVYFTSMSVSQTDVEEVLEVAIADAANPEAVIETLGATEDTGGRWYRYQFKYTPAESGDYYVAFHSATPKNTKDYSGTTIDDVKVYTGALPSVSADLYADLGSKENMGAPLSHEMEVANSGDGELTVSLKSISDGFSVEGLPLTVEEYDYETYTVKFDSSELGVHEGVLVLETNDPCYPEITVNLRAEVKEARVTDYIFETFENGGPEGWWMPEGVVNTADYAGHNNSARALYTWSYYSLLGSDPDGIGFATHFVNMGENPQLSFWYVLRSHSFFGDSDEPVPADRPVIYVDVLDSKNGEYERVYTIGPDGDEEHVVSDDYRQVTIPLEAYANKCCRIKVIVNHADGMMDAMMNPFVVLIDDMAIGTPPSYDIAATTLYGDGGPTVGEQKTASLEVVNRGDNAIAGYSVALYDAINDVELSSAEGEGLEPGEKAVVELPYSFEVAGYKELVAKVSTENDINLDNNTSNSLYIDVLGEGNSTYDFNTGRALRSPAFPICFSSVESSTQQIYPANNFGINAGQISSVVFTSNMQNPFLGEEFEIYVGETMLDDFSTVASVDPSTLTQVFVGTVYFPSGSHNVVIPFTESYNYKGGNLVVMTRKMGHEFVNGQEFIIHETDRPLSTRSTITEDGEFVKWGAVNCLAETRFNMISEETGVIAGDVKCGDTPLADVEVSVDGTKLTAVTDAQGQYSFPRLTAGEYTLTFNAHGYYPVSTTTTVTADENTTLDVELQGLPQYTLKGVVSDSMNGSAVAGARVAVTGYHDYQTVTAADGSYEIPGIYGDGSEENYVVRISHDRFENKAREILFDADKTENIELSATALRVKGVAASQEGNGVKVEWNVPSGELRHDTGDAFDYVGYPGGIKEVIFGNLFRCKAEIEEISWYVASGVVHSNFNVYVFGLDANGLPDNKNILYAAYNVDYTEDDWSVHKLPQPLVADGFMIAVSCSGFLNIGVCKPTLDYHFNPGMSYYAGESYTLGIFDFVNWQECHPMIRATIKVEGDEVSTPGYTYDVYRFNQGDADADWELVGSTTDLSFVDNSDVAVTPELRYAVVSRYNESVSKPVVSGEVKTSGISAPVADGAGVLRYDARTSTVIATGEVTGIEVINASGVVVMRATNEGAPISLGSLAPGIYIVRATGSAPASLKIKR